MNQKELSHRLNEGQQEWIKYADVFSTVQGHLAQQASQSQKVSGEKSPNNENESGISLASPSGSESKKKKKEITIGEALEATVLTAGKKNVDRSDAAAIQAAEVRATGRTNIMPGGLAATAQSAAQINARNTADQAKITTLADVLSGAASKLPKDRPVTRQDAEGVLGAELRNNPNISTYPGGVAASMVAAARINQSYAQLEK